jgi:glutamate 5-kinase
MSTRSKLMRGARRVIVKVGTGVLTRSSGVDRDILRGLAAQCAAIMGPKRTVVVVSSGAIGLGMLRLGLSERPQRMDALQACAAVGQGHLMRLWTDAFDAHAHIAAQVLLTHADFADRKRFLNVRRALSELLARGAVPVINENDTVAVDEISFGDNDALSSQVANVVDADVLVMLSVAEGLFDGERLVSEVRPDERVEKLVRAEKSAGGTGGMVTKVKAARAAAARGTAAIIAHGQAPNVLERVLAGEAVGTLFWPAGERLASRDHWIAHTLRARGTLIVDDGAAEALLGRKRSLLPSGIVEVRGQFRNGDPVDVVRADGSVLARGLSRYASGELSSIRGRRAKEITSVLGYHLGDEAIHRDDLVLLVP